MRHREALRGNYGVATHMISGAQERESPALLDAAWFIARRRVELMTLRPNELLTTAEGLKDLLRNAP